jgi:hypothetical protein
MGKNKSSAAVNKRTVESVISSAMNNEMPDGVYFAKVLSRLGEGRMKIYYEQSNKGHEGIGKIRGSLEGRGRCPIQTNDLIAVSSRDFESKNNKFDIICVFDSKQAYHLKKQKIIPDYFLNPMDSGTSVKKDEGGIEFDYDDEKDVDIDDI